MLWKKSTLAGCHSTLVAFASYSGGFPADYTLCLLPEDCVENRIIPFSGCGLSGPQLATVQPAIGNRMARSWKTGF